MNPMRTPNTATRLRRRGSIYAMVLGITMLITVIGIGALATSRVTTRSAGGSVEWQEAGALAFSAAEHAVAKLNADAAANPNAWRDAYTSGAVAFSATLGNGTMRWVLVDEDDGVMNDDYSDSIRLYGMGKAGSTKRVYSVQLTASGGGLDALKTAMHSAGGIVLGGPTYVLGGPISTNGNLTNVTNLKGGAGSEVAGIGGTSAPAKPMPPAGAFETYKARATTIASSVVASGEFVPGVLSADSNPYGAKNPDGIYYIRLPSDNSKVKIDDSRLKATLVVEAGTAVSAQELEIDNVYWESHSSSFPILITKGITTVRIRGNISAYSGTYPSELRGLIHLIGSTEVDMEDAAFIRGCLIADGIINTNGSTGVTANPSLFTTPPIGYTKGSRILPNPGTWKWDSPPAGVN